MGSSVPPSQDDGTVVRYEIDPNDPTPPSEQLARLVRLFVSSGRLESGERLPSVRKLAAQALVNANTAERAYRELERDGVVVKRPGAGVYVAPRALLACRSTRDRELRERVRRLVAEARRGGVTRAELERIWSELWDELEAQDLDDQRRAS